VENGVETGLFTPQATGHDSSGELRTSWNAERKFVVCYIGTMGWAHGLETLLESASQLSRISPDVLFLLVGEGADKARIQALAHSQGLMNLRFVDQQPRETIPAYIRASEACLVLLKKTELFKTVIPTKMLEFMSCARAVILGVDGQARAILEEAQAGIYIEPENADALVKAITELRDHPEQRASLGANGREYVMKHFSRQQTAQSYIDVLTALIKPTESR
jgi:colanic acid biosynthesis glycosyl transferase WcaI